MIDSQSSQSRSDLLEQSVTRAIAFLVSCQQEDGGFPVVRWQSNGTSVPDDRLFSTACILLAIGELLPSPYRHAAVALLQRRRDINGFWHFDAAGHLPADADDTACALAALLRFASTPEKPTDSDFERLTAFVHSDGRITTWLASGKLANADTDDVVVVANVIYAMALYDVSRARIWLTRWLALSASMSDLGPASDSAQYAASHISSGMTLASIPYYMHIETLRYAWVRVLRTLDIPRGSVTITSTASNSPLRCALTLSAMDDPDDDLVSFLLKSQHPQGFWPAEPWFRSPGACFGSIGLTTAFVVEALNRWQKAKEG